MTDNTPMVPTDDEIVAFAVENGVRVRTGKGAIKLVRAALDKWGTPIPVGVEPVARLEIEKTKGGVSLTHIAEPAAFQLQEGMYALYTAPQPDSVQDIKDGFSDEHTHLENVEQTVERYLTIFKDGITGQYYAAPFLHEKLTKASKYARDMTEYQINKTCVARLKLAFVEGQFDDI